MPARKSGIDWPRLIVSIAIPQAAGGLGAIATREGSRTWYPTLKKPSFNPPRQAFGPVWTALYLMMGIAEYLVAKERADKKITKAEFERAEGWYATQIGLNTLWSVIFFGFKRPFAALVELVVLLGAIVATVRSFFSVSRPAGLLLLPYLAWSSFATALNATIWWKNRGR